MKIKILISFILFLSLSINAQNLIDGAESVAYHAPTKTYFVSSLMNNRVVKIDSQNNYSIFKDGIIAFGNCIKGDTLFLSSGNSVNGIDVYTGNILFNISVAGTIQFDGMTYKGNNLYVVETRSNRILKVDISTGTYSYLVESGLEPATQDLFYDHFNDRILACAYGENTSIISIDPSTGDLTELVESYGRFDGITMDQNGFVYLSTHVNGGQIIMYDIDFTIEPIVIYQGIDEPAGLDYNLENRTLAVPSFVGDEVIFIEIDENYFYPDFVQDKMTGHAPLTVQFSSRTLTNHTVESFKWDFDNDGTVDSEEENPSFTYTQNGTYTVSLTVTSNLDQITVIKDSLIYVFDGESSLLMQNSESRAIVNYSPELNLIDKFTVEAYIFIDEYPTRLRGGTISDKSAYRFYITGSALGAVGDRSLVAALKLANGKTITITGPDDAIEIGKWQHVAFSFDSTQSEVKFYVNGNAIQATVLGSNPLEGGLVNNETNNLYIGNEANNSSGINGKIDEVRVWNFARSSGEILSTVKNTLSGNEQGLIAYWNMNEGNGNELIDNSPNNNTASIEFAPYRKGVDFESITSIESYEERSLVDNFALRQNYPNPFNPTTVIQYQIDEPSNVSLNVYDILGNEIAELFNAYETPGSYTIKWNSTDKKGNQVSSGIYFYSLRSNQNVITKKMILIR